MSSHMLPHVAWVIVKKVKFSKTELYRNDMDPAHPLVLQPWWEGRWSSRVFHAFIISSARFLSTLLPKTLELTGCIWSGRSQSTRQFHTVTKRLYHLNHQLHGNLNARRPTLHLLHACCFRLTVQYILSHSSSKTSQLDGADPGRTKRSERIGHLYRALNNICISCIWNLHAVLFVKCHSVIRQWSRNIHKAQIHLHSGAIHFSTLQSQFFPAC